MLVREAAERRSELRRTRNPDFRSKVSHSLDLLDHMHAEILGALSVQ